MTIPSVLTAALEWWTGVYANHAALRTAVSFGHIGGLLGGGGCAIAADRATLMFSSADAGARAAHLTTVRQVHRVVTAGLALLFASGLLLLGADLDTYLGSRVFWFKMVLIGGLLINGVTLIRAERRARSDPFGGWRTFRRASIVSLALWLLTTLLGAALPNIG